MDLQDLLKDLDENLVMIKNEKKENKIYITCKSVKAECACPYCNKTSSSVHSQYVRTLGDLPIQNNEVKLLLIVRKFFCSNENCNHKTYGERFDFVEPKSVRTKRLDKYINKMGLRDNSMDTVRNLKDAGISVSSNTVLRIIKKNKK